MLPGQGACSERSPTRTLTGVHSAMVTLEKYYNNKIMSMDLKNFHAPKYERIRCYVTVTPSTHGGPLFDNNLLFDERVFI
jgi:hypothetical protein